MLIADIERFSGGLIFRQFVLYFAFRYNAAMGWLSEHWFDFLQTVGIVATLLLAAYTSWKDDRARRIGNSIAINDQHRKIWKDIYEHRELARVLDTEADPKDI